MKKENFTFSIIVLFFLNVSVLKAQQAVLSSGKDATGNGGSVSYSVGQIGYQTFSGSNGTLVQGVQQPYEISVVLGLNPDITINENIALYPNPVLNYLTIKLIDVDINEMSFRLYDIQGKLLHNKTIIEKETNVEMNNLPKAIYLLEILKNNSILKTFKIIKKD